MISHPLFTYLEAPVLTVFFVVLLILALLYGPQLARYVSDMRLLSLFKYWRIYVPIWLALILALRGFVFTAFLLLIASWGSTWLLNMSAFQKIRALLISRLANIFQTVAEPFMDTDPILESAPTFTQTNTTSEKLALQGAMFWFLCVERDPGKNQVLEQELNRVFPGWRTARDNNRSAWTKLAQNRHRLLRGQPFSEQEALQLFGLNTGSTTEEIIRTHHKLMKKVHPDLGGPAIMATVVNQARDILTH